MGEAQEMSSLMRTHIEQAGVLVNEGKSCWKPAQTVSWLGFEFDSLSMRIYVTETKIDKVILLASRLLERNITSSRKDARLVGLIISMHRALGNEARIMTRKLSHWIDDVLDVQNAVEAKYKVTNANEACIYEDRTSLFG